MASKNVTTRAVISLFLTCSTLTDFEMLGTPPAISPANRQQIKNKA